MPIVLSFQFELTVNYLVLDVNAEKIPLECTGLNTGKVDVEFFNGWKHCEWLLHFPATFSPSGGVIYILTGRAYDEHKHVWARTIDNSSDTRFSYLLH